MSDFSHAWVLSRKRFVDEIGNLNSEQLNWRIYPGALTIGEMALHVAGVELSFGSQLLGTQLEGFAQKVAKAATQGVVNKEPFPFDKAEITPELVSDALKLGSESVQPLIDAAEPAMRQKELKSALGPMITGEGAFARFGFHPGYHQGQAYLIKNSPGFPR